MTLQRAFGACGQDYEAMRKGACASGVASRDWGFVGSGTCDDDVRAQGDANCKGRSFTGMDRALGPLCSRYASLVRGAHQADDVAALIATLQTNLPKLVLNVKARGEALVSTIGQLEGNVEGVLSGGADLGAKACACLKASVDAFVSVKASVNVSVQP